MKRRKTCEAGDCPCEALLAEQLDPGVGLTARQVCPHGRMFVVAVEYAAHLRSCLQLLRESATRKTGARRAFARLFGDHIRLTAAATKPEAEPEKKAKANREKEPGADDRVTIHHQGDNSRISLIPGDEWRRRDVGAEAEAIIEGMTLGAGTRSRHRTLVIDRYQNGERRRSRVRLRIEPRGAGRQPGYRIYIDDAPQRDDAGAIRTLRNTLMAVAPPLRTERRKL